MVKLPEEILYDKRLIERHIRLGLITQADVDKRLDKLSDLKAQGEIIDLTVLTEEVTGQSYGNGDASGVPM